LLPKLLLHLPESLHRTHRWALVLSHAWVRKRVGVIVHTATKPAHLRRLVKATTESTAVAAHWLTTATHTKPTHLWAVTTTKTTHAAHLGVKPTHTVAATHRVVLIEPTTHATAKTTHLW
jgi:hypothetical protein